MVKRATKTLQVQHAFLYISLPSLHDYDEKLPNFTFYGGREHETTTFFSFSRTSIQSLGGEFKRDGISAMMK